MRREGLTVAARVDVASDGHCVLTVDASACGRCAGCFLGERTQRVDLRDFPGTASLHPETPVTLHLPADTLVSAALVLYGLPLAALLGGAALGALVVGHGDVPAVIGGGVGLAAAALAARRARSRVERALRDRLSIAPSA